MTQCATYNTCHKCNIVTRAHEKNLQGNFFIAPGCTCTYTWIYKPETTDN